MARTPVNGLDGPSIRQLREERGWTQQQLVQEIRAVAAEWGLHVPAVNVHMISKWENGHVRVGHQYTRLIEAAFARTMNLDTEPGRYDMDRRRFLAGATGVGALTLASTMGLEPWQRLSSALQRRSHVDEATVDHLETMTTTFSQLFLTVSPIALLAPARSHLDSLTQFLTDGSIPAKLRQRLASMASESAILLGWLMQDGGDEAVAQEFYLTALDAAAEANDPAIGAYAIASASTLEAFRSSPAQSIHLLTDATVKGSSVRNATPSTRAWAHSLIAEAHTRDGNAAGALTALDTAHDILDQAAGDEPRPRSTFFDRARLAGERGVTGVRLGLPEQAEPALNEAMATLHDDPKTESRILTNLARVHLQRREVEQACATVIQSLDLAQRTGSKTGVRDIRDFRHQLEPWNDLDMVQQLDDHLAIVLS